MGLTDSVKAAFSGSAIMIISFIVLIAFLIWGGAVNLRDLLIPSFSGQSAKEHIINIGTPIAAYLAIAGVVIWAFGGGFSLKQV